MKISKKIFILLELVAVSTFAHPSRHDSDRDPSVCSTAEFECASGQLCIPSSWACDGEIDCKDQSDEMGCSPDKINSCGPEEFRCGSGQCIPLDWQCDGEFDCTDKLDEWDNICNKTTVSSTCKGDEFLCPTDGTCIPAHWVCDGTEDCLRDAADEENCKFRCTSGEFRCRSNDSCIQDRWVCDGTNDCQDGSDEAEDICTSKIDISRCDPDTQLRCTQTRGCYALEQRCDGQNDCSDGTDELDCDEIDVNEGEDDDGDTVECSDDNVWKCDSQDQCISLDWVCDGDKDCKDGSDESATSCPHVDKHKNTTNVNLLRKDSLLQEKKTKNETTSIIDQNDKISKESVSDYRSSKIAKDSLLVNDSNIYDDAKEDNVEVEDIIKVKVPSKTSDIIAAKVCDLTMEFDCGEGLGCVPRDRVCDHLNDCGNWADEPSTCHTEEDTCLRNNGGCQHVCKQTEDGHMCSCHPGFKLVGNSSCHDINECEENKKICSHSCKNKEGSYECECSSGYTVHPSDHHLCEVSSGHVEILLSNGSDLTLLTRDSGETTRVLRLATSPGHVVTYQLGRLVFWVDSVAGKLMRASMGSDRDQFMELISSGLDSKDTLTVDWINNNLYWASNKRNAIIATRFNGEYEVEIIKNIESPNSVVVDPDSSTFCWSESKNSSSTISCADMDGTKKHVIVSDQDLLGYPTSLTIGNHQTDKKLYWLDTKYNQIASSNLDGSDIKILSSDPEYLRNPLSIAVFEDWVYWNNASHIFRIQKNLNDQKHEKIETLDHHISGQSLGSISIFHYLSQPRDPRGSTCYNRKQKCSHMCVSTSGESSSCLCPIGLSLSADKSTCLEDGIASNPILASRKFEEISRSEEDDKFLILLVVGTVGGSMFLILLIIIAVVKCKTSASSDSLDSLDSYEKPPLLNRHLYQAPRRATFSKCIPESESMVPLNGEGSVSSKLSSVHDSSSSSENSESQASDEIESCETESV